MKRIAYFTDGSSVSGKKNLRLLPDLPAETTALWNCFYEGTVCLEKKFGKPDIESEFRVEKAE